VNRRDFKNPEKRFRPSPFWSWNDALDPDELRWQVREFASKGFGGYFMHSRVGLATPYLSPEWMRCIRACLEEGTKMNVESWLYDEDKWPSGFAGGFVPAKNEEYRAKIASMKEIKAEEVPEALGDPTALGVFEITFSGPTTIDDYKRIRKPEEIKGNSHLFMFKVEPSDHKNRNWYNGESYVDLLNPEVTEEFLKVTLDAYAEEFRGDFGEFMPGIFTDEPNYEGRRHIPWTREMLEYFQRINGYDVRDKLPLLHFDGVGCHRVRYDFWRTVTLRFIEAFTAPYAERCTVNGLKMTGHYLCEDNLDIQTRCAGAAMPHYEYMPALGIDHLGRNINDPLTLKQCSSVAHQFGRTRVLSELFGCSGHSMTFEDQKWIGDFHLALGITFFCPHLTLYTMKGDAKRDYPPTLSYHQPYWEHFKLINDYFARASYICSQGKFRADILVLHSIGSAWATFVPTAEGRETLPWKYNNALVKLQDDLLALHRDFDYGDEVILSRHGRVRGKEIVVKESSYRTVIVPPSLTWSSATIDLLKGFLDAGGKVIFVGETPSFVGGEPLKPEWAKILLHPNAVSVGTERSAVAKALDAALPRLISVTDEQGSEVEDILIHQRVDGALRIYFLVNKSRTNSYNVVIKVPEKGEVTEWDMFNGSVSQTKVVTRKGQTVIRVLFHPVESHAFVIDTATQPATSGSLPKAGAKERITKLPREWSFTTLHANSLILDAWEYSFGDGRWREKMPTWKIRREAWKEAGLEAYFGIQPWVLATKMLKPSKSFDLQLRTGFKSEVRGKRAFLVVERASIWKLTINGRQVSAKTAEWHWDRQFGRIDISDHVKVGENTIELSCRYDRDVPVEDMYLVGDFGVKKISETEHALADKPKVLRNGSWVEQRYPFYAGTMRYRTTFNLRTIPKGHVLIRLPKAKGTLFLVRVNRKKPVPVCWQPLEADVTNLVHKGKNELAIEVISSLRNTFGPLHHKGGDLYFVGPFSFIDEGNWTAIYQLVPYGLIDGAEIVTRK